MDANILFTYDVFKKEYKCTITNCNYHSYDENNLTNHINSHIKKSNQKHKPQKHKQQNKNDTILDIEDYLLRRPYGDKWMDKTFLSHDESTNKYKCEVTKCGYSHIKKARVLSHILIHTGETPHKCPYENCKYSSNRHDTLQSHIKSKHTKEKIYNCAYCDYSASTKNTLFHHNKKHQTKGLDPALIASIKDEQLI
jgi:KRAB domain-containing zinc finger protein